LATRVGKRRRTDQIGKIVTPKKKGKMEAAAARRAAWPVEGSPLLVLRGGGPPRKRHQEDGMRLN